jgi:activator of HSP90 ATPase
MDMTPPIIEWVKLYTTPEDLYRTYVDSAKHSEMTGMPAEMSEQVGAKWSAFGGSIYGTNLMFVPGKMIVQTWRSTEFKKTDSDSIMVMNFSKTTDGAAQIHLVHVNVAEQDHKGVTNGWKQYYWDPWRAYIKKLKGKK